MRAIARAKKFKMASASDVFLVLLILYVTLLIKKECFTTSNGIENTTEDYLRLRTESCMLQCLWSFSHGNKIHIVQHATKKSMLLILLILCGDVETCPGPLQQGIPEVNRLLNLKGLNIFHQNIRGLQSNFLGLRELFNAHNNINILILSETHLNESNDYDDLYDVPGYVFIKRNRTCGKGGGVAIYIKDSIEFQRRFDLENSKLENIIIEILINKSKSFIVTTFYRPPETSNYLPKNFNELFEDNLSYITAE